MKFKNYIRTELTHKCLKILIIHLIIPPWVVVVVVVEEEEW